jgi:hypothetical protein
MDYIERLESILSLNEFTNKEARAQWDVLTNILGFQQKRDGGVYGLYLPPQDRLDALRSAGWPEVTWAQDFPKEGGIKGKTVRPGDLMHTTHGSSAKSVGGISTKMSQKFGIILGHDEQDTYNNWLLALSKKIGDMKLIYQYANEKYPQHSRQNALEQLWIDSLSRPAAVAMKIRTDHPAWFSKSPAFNAYDSITPLVKSMAAKQGKGDYWVKNMEEISDMTKEAISSMIENNDDRALEIANELEIVYHKIATLRPSGKVERDAQEEYLKKLQIAQDAALSPVV